MFVNVAVCIYTPIHLCFYSFSVVHMTGRDSWRYPVINFLLWLRSYNCGDHRCYSDLARLRGVDYMTWSDGDLKAEPKPRDQYKHHKYGHNPKFWNWWFDPRRFRQLMKEARDRVLSNPLFVKALHKSTGSFQDAKTELWSRFLKNYFYVHSSLAIATTPDHWVSLLWKYCSETSFSVAPLQLEARFASLYRACNCYPQPAIT